MPFDEGNSTALAEKKGPKPTVHGELAQAIDKAVCIDVDASIIYEPEP